MSYWETLLANINTNIKENNNKEITGPKLNSVLSNLVKTIGEHRTFIGIADINTSPGIPNGPVFYFASEYGVYPNFNGISVPENTLSILINDEQGAWKVNTIIDLSSSYTPDPDSWRYAGIIKPNDSPLIYSAPVFYLTTTPGVYSNFPGVYNNVIIPENILALVYSYKTEEGNIAWAWEKIIDTPQQAVNYDYIGTLIDLDISGLISKEDGSTIINEEDYLQSAPILLKGQKALITYTGEVSNEEGACIALYNCFTDQFIKVLLGHGTYVNEKVIIPIAFQDESGIAYNNKGCYIKVCSKRPTDGQSKISICFSNDRYKINIQSSIDVPFDEKGYLTAEGEFLTDLPTSVIAATKLINISPGDLVKYTGALPFGEGTPALNFAGYVFYNVFNIPISVHAKSRDAAGIFYEDDIAEAPADSAFVRACALVKSQAGALSTGNPTFSIIKSSNNTIKSNNGELLPVNARFDSNSTVIQGDSAKSFTGNDARLVSLVGKTWCVETLVSESDSDGFFYISNMRPYTGVLDTNCAGKKIDISFEAQFVTSGPPWTNGYVTLIDENENEIGDKCYLLTKGTDITRQSRIFKARIEIPNNINILRVKYYPSNVEKIRNFSIKYADDYIHVKEEITKAVQYGYSHPMLQENKALLGDGTLIDNSKYAVVGWYPNQTGYNTYDKSILGIVINGYFLPDSDGQDYIGYVITDNGEIVKKGNLNNNGFTVVDLSNIEFTGRCEAKVCFINPSNIDNVKNLLSISGNNLSEYDYNIISNPSVHSLSYYNIMHMIGKITKFLSL